METSGHVLNTEGENKLIWCPTLDQLVIMIPWDFKSQAYSVCTGCGASPPGNDHIVTEREVMDED